jgi:hypothetical protein
MKPQSDYTLRLIFLEHKFQLCVGLKKKNAGVGSCILNLLPRLRITLTSAGLFDVILH